MATFTAIHVRNADLESLVKSVMRLAAIKDRRFGAYPEDYCSSFLSDEHAVPNYLLIRESEDGWITIRHNSFRKMESWAKTWSRDYVCEVLVTTAQTTADSYYFAYYEDGKQLRLIDTCYSTDCEMVNRGEPFDFEGPEPGQVHVWDDEECYLFDLDSIDHYCKRFGLTLQFDPTDHDWIILKGAQDCPTIHQLVQLRLKQGSKRRPWWKFWK